MNRATRQWYYGEKGQLANKWLYVNNDGDMYDGVTPKHPEKDTCYKSVHTSFTHYFKMCKHNVSKSISFCANSDPTKIVRFGVSNICTTHIQYVDELVDTKAHNSYDKAIDHIVNIFCEILESSKGLEIIKPRYNAIFQTLMDTRDNDTIEEELRQNFDPLRRFVLFPMDLEYKTIRRDRSIRFITLSISREDLKYVFHHISSAIHTNDVIHLSSELKTYEQGVQTLANVLRELYDVYGDELEEVDEYADMDYILKRFNTS